MTKSYGDHKVLIANRGEIAVRINRTLREMGIKTVAIHPADDADSLHVNVADNAIQIDGDGVAAYLDVAQIVQVAKSCGCTAIHPGYGFLSENVAFADDCAAAGLMFIGPSSTALQLFGNKLDARQLAAENGVPVLPASGVLTNPSDAAVFFESLPSGSAVMLKAVAGGGGRGMRIVRAREELNDAIARGRAEAQAAFGNGELYAEALIERTLHIEIQILGDKHGNVSHLGERDCSIQRRHQKIVEVAPSPQLPETLRSRITEAALTLASAVKYDNIGTFEFLVDGRNLQSDSQFYYIETNPRLQVEHTVTEQVTGVDLVRTQLELALGRELASLGLDQQSAPTPRGYSIQLRVNMEELDAEGAVTTRTGTIAAFKPPTGPGVRVDTFGYEGYQTSSSYDSLLAKLIISVGNGTFQDAIARTVLSVQDFEVEGVPTNLNLLCNILEHKEVQQGRMYTGFIDDHREQLAAQREPASNRRTKPQQTALAGAKVDTRDPLAVLSRGRSQREAERAQIQTRTYADGLVPVTAVMQSTILSIAANVGEKVLKGQEIFLLNAMKMEHEVKSPVSGTIREINIGVGDTVPEQTVLMVIEKSAVDAEWQADSVALDLDTPRPDLAEVLRRRSLTSDESRVKQKERRHSQDARTARENIYDLADEGTFVQYGSLAIGQGLHGSVDELLDYAPSDGLVMGLGHVNGDNFDETRSRCVLMSYDYTVLAGSQGGMNHKMMDRMFQTAFKLQSPLVLFTEGGGGRAGGGSRNARPGRGGSPQISGGGGLNTPSWTLLSKLSGRVPVVGVNAGFCFAGNAVLLGCCDVIIATENSSIGIGGPAMIEGGGLGVYSPEEVGPMSVQVPSGVVDIAVRDEAEAVQATKKYLSYFQGPLEDWKSNDQRLLRHVVPENRLRVYDIRELIQTLADKNSVLELRPEFGTAMVTSFIRIEGRPMGVIANNPAVISGAIDSDAADKAARFMKTCDAFNIPLLLLCDCPGIMVGPEVEKTGLVRHAARMFVIGANIQVPSYMVILRKAYGLGAQAMGGGNHRLPAFVVAWPTSEFGGMGLEGQVKLGQRARLEAIEDLSERQAAYERMVEAAYNRGKGLNAGHVFEVDDVIDPADTRKWIVAGMKANSPIKREPQLRVPIIDAW